MDFKVISVAKSDRIYSIGQKIIVEGGGEENIKIAITLGLIVSNVDK